MIISVCSGSVGYWEGQSKDETRNSAARAKHLEHGEQVYRMD